MDPITPTHSVSSITRETNVQEAVSDLGPDVFLRLNRRIRCRRAMNSRVLLAIGVALFVVLRSRTAGALVFPVGATISYFRPDGSLAFADQILEVVSEDVRLVAPGNFPGQSTNVLVSTLEANIAEWQQLGGTVVIS